MLRSNQTTAAGVLRRKVDPGGRLGLDDHADAISEALVKHEMRINCGRVTREYVNTTTDVRAFDAVLGGVVWDDTTVLEDNDGATVTGVTFDPVRGRWTVDTPAVFTYTPTVTGYAYMVDHAAADIAEMVATDLGAGSDFTTAGGESFTRSGPVERLLETARRLRAGAPLHTVPVNTPSNLR